MAARPGLLRALRLLGSAAVVGGVYFLNLRAPSELRLEILYIIPVLLAAWHDGIHWGIAFALATSLLRFTVGIDQLPPTTLLDYRVLNELDVTDSDLVCENRDEPPITAAEDVLDNSGRGK